MPARWKSSERWFFAAVIAIVILGSTLVHWIDQAWPDPPPCDCSCEELAPGATSP
jgi:hypothetical protein